MKARQHRPDLQPRTSGRYRLRWGEPGGTHGLKGLFAFDDDAYHHTPVARINKLVNGAKHRKWLWTMPLLEHGVLRVDSCSGWAASKREAKSKAEECYFRARITWLQQRNSWQLSGEFDT